MRPSAPWRATFSTPCRSIASVRSTPTTRAVLPAAGGLTGGRPWFDVGRFLGPNIEQHYRDHPLASTVTAWNEAGLDDVGTRLMSLGGGVVVWGTKRGSAR